MDIRKLSAITIFLCFSIPSFAGGYHLKNRFLDKLYSIAKDFSRIDTDYIEPQKYNYAVMLQNTNTYEMYRIANSLHQSVDLAPDPSYKIGPYFGWRWIFLGYTLDVTHLSSRNKRKGIDLSLYSNQLGIDLFYRTTGDDYHIRKIDLNDNQKIDVSSLKGVNFGGLHADIRGFNLYYITNHKKFSYPAAYSQSTIQRKSCGSALAGIGYTKHKIEVNWARLNELVEERLGAFPSHPIIDSTMVLGNIEYSDYSISGGYAYNWVFAHNWLFDVSLQGAVGYKHSKSDLTNSRNVRSKDFDLSNFNLDGILRLGIVWNNMRWYVGSNAVFHGYSYNKRQFSMNNMFGNLNIYVGYNFGKRH